MNRTFQENKAALRQTFGRIRAALPPEEREKSSMEIQARLLKTKQYAAGGAVLMAELLAAKGYLD